MPSSQAGRETHWMRPSSHRRRREEKGARSTKIAAGERLGKLGGLFLNVLQMFRVSDLAEPGDGARWCGDTLRAQ